MVIVESSEKSLWHTKHSLKDIFMSKEQKAEKNLKEENVDNLRKKRNTLEKIHCDKCRSRHFFE